MMFCTPFFIAALSAAELATVPKTFTASDGGIFRYRWHEPTTVVTNQLYPLVILMHGSGECGTNNVSQLTWGATPIVNWFESKHQEYYLLAGQVPPSGLWSLIGSVATTPTLSKNPTRPMSQQIELLKGLIEGDLPIDRDRVYVTGVSMGGYGTWDLISRYPDWFAAAMPVCGGGDLSKAASLKNLPILIHHGAEDGNVAPWNSRAMYAALIFSGSNCARYIEYPNCGHNSWHQAYGNTANLDWLFAQRRPPAPKWTPVEPLRDATGAIVIPTPTPHYEIELKVKAEGHEPIAVVGRRSGVFPLVTVGGRVVERLAFRLILGDKQVVIRDSKSGVSFTYSDIRIRPLAKGEK